MVSSQNLAKMVEAAKGLKQPDKDTIEAIKREGVTEPGEPDLEQQLLNYIEEAKLKLTWKQLTFLITEISEGIFFQDHLILNVHCAISEDREVSVISSKRMLNTDSSWTVVEVFLLKRKEDGRVVFERILLGGSDLPYDTVVKVLVIDFMGERFWYYYREGSKDNVFEERIDTKNGRIPSKLYL